MSKSGGKFFLAGVIGALAGTIGGLLLAPKSGKETRDDIAKLALEISKRIKTETDETKKRVKEIFGKVTTDTTQKYKEIRTSVVTKVASAKTAGNEIDKDKYAKVVDGVIEEYKDDLKATKEGATKISGYLKKDWEKVKKALV
ncbi:MAG TPA: YtxH domain-containing protein [Candidatus Woesebacteria bacterium]|nr:YtxH domain-containing protein [Candidatus Woesebacteria bacterium]HPJ16903.1 YtxH domain-containing protein [Candidatus Woesebacteria bacterium]